MELEGKVAVITGGAVRVGRALTLALAEAGCDVFIHYGRSAAPAQQTGLMPAHSASRRISTAPTWPTLLQRRASSRRRLIDADRLTF